MDYDKTKEAMENYYKRAAQDYSEFIKETLRVFLGREPKSEDVKKCRMEKKIRSNVSSFYYKDTLIGHFVERINYEEEKYKTTITYEFFKG